MPHHFTSPVRNRWLIMAGLVTIAAVIAVFTIAGVGSGGGGTIGGY